LAAQRPSLKRKKIKTSRKIKDSRTPMEIKLSKLFDECETKWKFIYIYTYISVCLSVHVWIPAPFGVSWLVFFRYFHSINRSGKCTPTLVVFICVCKKRFKLICHEVFGDGNKPGIHFTHISFFAGFSLFDMVRKLSYWHLAWIIYVFDIKKKHIPSTHQTGEPYII